MEVLLQPAESEGFGRCHDCPALLSVYRVVTLPSGGHLAQDILDLADVTGKSSWIAAF